EGAGRSGVVREEGAVFGSGEAGLADLVDEALGGDGRHEVGDVFVVPENRGDGDAQGGLRIGDGRLDSRSREVHRKDAEGFAGEAGSEKREARSGKWDVGSGSE